jgi:hypothetical protein
VWCKCKGPCFYRSLVLLSFVEMIIFSPLNYPVTVKAKKETNISADILLLEKTHVHVQKWTLFCSMDLLFVDMLTASLSLLHYSKSQKTSGLVLWLFWLFQVFSLYIYILESTSQCSQKAFLYKLMIIFINLHRHVSVGILMSTD